MSAIGVRRDKANIRLPMFTNVHQSLEIIKIRQKRVAKYLPLTIRVHARILVKPLDKGFGTWRGR
jgi:hypothetical protein